MRRRQVEALKSAAGAWKDKDHPELKQGAAQWERKLRREGERRLRKRAGPMAVYLLDTSVIIDVLNDKKKRTSLLLTLAEQGHVLACCPINVAEVYAGLRAHEEERTSNLLRSLRMFPITFAVAELAGRLKDGEGRH